MAEKKKLGLSALYDGLAAWQRHRDVTDAQMAKVLNIGVNTWRRYRTGQTLIPHLALVTAVNYLRIPYKDAGEIIMAGVHING